MPIHLECALVMPPPSTASGKTRLRDEPEDDRAD
jgi:hypothetical protein